MIFFVFYALNIDIIDLLLFSSTMYFGWKVMCRVQPRLALCLSRAEPASWYEKPKAGSLRAHFEETLEQALPWLLAAMCGCLAMQIELGFLAWLL